MKTSFDNCRVQQLYRSRNGMCCGVLQGFANYQGFSVFWTRVVFVALTIATSIAPGIFFYFIAALVMKPEPTTPLNNLDDHEFYASVQNSKSLALHRLKKTYQSLDRRIGRIESIVTSKDYDWESRFQD